MSATEERVVAAELRQDIAAFRRNWLWFVLLGVALIAALVASLLLKKPGQLAAGPLYADYFPSRSRARVAGFLGLTATLGTAVSAPVCGLLLSTLGWQAATLALAVLTLHRLGASDLCSGDAGVEAVFVQQMVVHHELLFPVENGKQPMYKPPLFHWTAAAFDRLGGIDHVTVRGVRSVSAGYAMAGAVLTMVAAAALLGAEGAVLAGLALAGS